MFLVCRQRGGLERYFISFLFYWSHESASLCFYLFCSICCVSLIFVTCSLLRSALCASRHDHGKRQILTVAPILRAGSSPSCLLHDRYVVQPGLFSQPAAETPACLKQCDAHCVAVQVVHRVACLCEHFLPARLPATRRLRNCINTEQPNAAVQKWYLWLFYKRSKAGQ